ncbi:hypothetical protein DVH24_026469 [Malus domestica]|uniref:Uncharacterized protein n=1 Tax=Malus domestica TaxID=3750 RepID=A0A498KQ96_MALDO|nr:hypothetical protein DVH24_026469 [Malus domestica]
MQSSWKQRMAEWEKTAVELQMMSSKRMEMREPYETFHGEMVAASACISAADSFQKEITNQVENNEARESTEN